MIRSIGEWVRRVVRRLHLAPTDPVLEAKKQHQEAIKNMAARAQAEYRETRLRAELERLRLIQEARRGT